MTKRVEIQNLLYWSSRTLLGAGSVLVLALVLSVLFWPQYMKLTFIGSMVCFALATIIALINTFLGNNHAER